MVVMSFWLLDIKNVRQIKRLFKKVVFQEVGLLRYMDFTLFKLTQNPNLDFGH